MEKCRQRNKEIKGEYNVDSCTDIEDFSDESVKDIKFKDSEKERMNEFDEGFDEGLCDGQPTTIHAADGAGSSEAMKQSFITPDMDKEHVIEDEFMTDKLDSDVKDNNSDDSLNVVRFNKEDEITKDFKFKVEMNFFNH